MLGVIYRIYGTKDDKTMIYIGCTCEKRFNDRISKHITAFRLYNLKKFHYVSSFDVLSLDNWNFEIIESINTNDKNEIFKNEVKHMNYYKNLNGYNLVNKVIKKDLKN